MWKQKKKKRCDGRKCIAPQYRSGRQSLRSDYKQLERPLPAWHGGGLLSGRCPVTLKWLMGRRRTESQVTYSGGPQRHQLAFLGIATHNPPGSDTSSVAVFETNSKTDDPPCSASERVQNSADETGRHLVPISPPTV